MKWPQSWVANQSETKSHISYCVTANSHSIPMSAHEHYPISSSLTHISLLSQIYFTYRTPKWQLQDLVSHLLLCTLFSGTFGNYVRATCCFFGHRPKPFWNDQKIMSFQSECLKIYANGYCTMSFDANVRQITKMSQRKKSRPHETRQSQMQLVTPDLNQIMDKNAKFISRGQGRNFQRILFPNIQTASKYLSWCIYYLDRKIFDLELSKSKNTHLESFQELTVSTWNCPWISKQFI